MVNTEGLKYYFENVDNVPQKILDDVFALIEEYNTFTETKETKRKSPNTSGVVQVDAETGKEIARFATKKEANIAIGKKENSSGISDAANGRSSTHKAYGYKWYQDVIPLTQLNIPNEALIDLTKGIDITYHIYF